MNIYDPYPDEVEFDGKTIKLDLSFDRVLMALDLQDDPQLTTGDRIELQARLLLADERDLPRTVNDQAALVGAALALVPKGEESNEEKFIDFHQDAAMIRSAFFRIGVDLSRDHLHIQRFLELLGDLPSDTALMRTIEIRRRPVPKPNKHNAEQIAELMKAKAKVAIKMSEEERRERFAQSLKNSTALRG